MTARLSKRAVTKRSNMTERSTLRQIYSTQFEMGTTGGTEVLDCCAPKIVRAREMRREGKRHREIASALGVCAATASVWTRGIVPHGKQSTDPRKAEVLPLLERLYREGRSI